MRIRWSTLGCALLVLGGWGCDGATAGGASPGDLVPGGDLPAAGAVDGIERRCPPAAVTPHMILDIADADGPLSLADPCVIRADGAWYLYATAPGPGYTAFRSTDLLTWEDRGPVWEPTPGSWAAGAKPWAPHVMAGDGGYYMYYTAHEMIGIAWSESPEGPFGEIYDHPFVGAGYGGVGDGVFEWADTETPAWDFEEKSIDAFVLEASDGSLTFYATQYTPLSSIIAIPMTDLRILAPEGLTVIISPDLNSWEQTITEGPWVNEVNGRFLLTYSGSGADRPMYSLGAAVADSPLGPFTRTPESPFLVPDFENGFYGPGHHSIVEGPCGELLLFYHTKTVPEIGWDRRLRVTPITLHDTEVILPPLR